MSPLKNEFLLKLSLGHKIIAVGDFSIDVQTGKIIGEIPKEIEGHVENIRRNGIKYMKRKYRVESIRQTRRRRNITKRNRSSV